MEKIKTQDVLKALAVGAILIATPIIPPLPMVLVKAYRLWKDVNRQDLGRIIKRLEKQEMIALREIGDKVQIEITEKGKRRLLEYDFENIKLKAKRRDGKWRLIVFDIPEKKRHARDVFRRKLLQLGFVRLQDSVFVSAFPCRDEVDFLCHFLEISDYVTIATVGRIERGEELFFKEYRSYNHDS